MLQSSLSSLQLSARQQDSSFEKMEVFKKELCRLHISFSVCVHKMFLVVDGTPIQFSKTLQIKNN